MNEKRKCHHCGKSFEPKHPSQRFCPKLKNGQHRCKDRYHNRRAELRRPFTYENYLDSVHPFSSEALGQD